MFDNVAFNVVLGLVFIYLLYSLLVTTLGEFISTKLGIRARLLRIAIERMLNDGYYVKIERREKRAADNFFKERWLSVLGWARKVLLYEPDEFKHSVAGKFYDYPAIKYLSRIEDFHKGRFSLTKPAYLSADYFAETLIDFLKDKGAGSSDIEKVAFCLKFNTHHFQPKSLRQLKNLFEKEGIDKTTFKLNLVKWFNETMDRASGWHKRKMQLISFWLGIIIAISFNLDTITIATRLARDKNAREQLVQMSIQASDTNSAISKAIKNSSDLSIKNDTLLSKGFKEVNKAVDEAHEVLGLGWDNVKPEKVYIIKRDWSFLYYRQFHPFRKEFWGLIVTALALSLGAPFWFDLLNKLVSIRGVGIKPEEKKVIPNTTQENILEIKDGVIQAKISQQVTPVVDVVEAALKLYSPQIKNIPGVKSVFSVMRNGVKQLQVNVDNAVTKTEVSKQFPQFVVGNVEVPYSIVASGTPVSHAGGEGVIANKSGKNGYGSLGCVLIRKDTGSTHILSCWHVLKGDLNYSGSDDEPIIIDHQNGDVLAERWAGGIRDQFDYGMAICYEDIFFKDNSFLKLKFGLSANVKLDYRFVSQADIDKQIPIKYYDSLTNTIKKGLVYTDTTEIDINYIDKSRTIKDVLIVTDENEETISKEGNSGSIVFDEKNKAIAMIIGGDLNYSYAVKLSHIFMIHQEMNFA